eukprot:247371_1
MNPAILWFGAGALGVYGYATGRLSNMVDNFKNKSDTSQTSRSATTQSQSRAQLADRPPTIIVQPSNTGRVSYLLPLGCACFVGLGGYYYYIHNNGTKKVIYKVKETAQETQDLVQKTDDNNAKRFSVLDKKNEDRSQNLELQIRSEQRAGFNIISEQIYCLTQVAIQTLSAVASSSTTKENDNANPTNEKLLGYCDKAQEMADTILSDDHLLKAKENNLKDIKAEIQLASNQQQQVMMMKSEDVTPGGPPMKNPFDLGKETQSPQIIKHIQMDDQDEQDEGILATFNQTVKPLQMAYYVYDNKQYVMLSSGIVLALYIGNKTIDYFSTETVERKR